MGLISTSLAFLIWDFQGGRFLPVRLLRGVALTISNILNEGGGL